MLRTESLNFTYNGADKPTLRDINIAVSAGQVALLCGASGSGKSTLLHSLKREIRPAGKYSGNVALQCQSEQTAIVFQNPNSQITCKTVMHELVFPMENIGLPNAVIQKRLAETVSFLGIEKLLHIQTENLSGGQKQLVNLSSALMTHPKILLLDEPTAMLDPIAARTFNDMLLRINKEMGITLIVAEHIINDMLPFADKLYIMNDGKICAGGVPSDVLRHVWQSGDAENCCCIPQVQQLLLCTKKDGDVALSPKRGVTLVKKRELPDETVSVSTPLVKLKNVTFAYGKTENVVLNRLNLDVYKNEILCVTGGNGSGKTTLLKIIAGILKPRGGSIKANGTNGTIRAAYIPQNVAAYFTADVAGDQLQGEEERKRRLIDMFGLNSVLHLHPYDLSGGEKQRLALASALLLQPDVLLLDEPTKGMDNGAKFILASLLKQTSVTAVINTHDLEFAAGAAGRCALLFDGGVVFQGTPRQLFAGNQYYTTPISKLVRDTLPEAINLKDVFYQCEINFPQFLRHY